MSANATYSRQNTFFVCLSQSRRNALLLDYDGTLAPFRPERNRAAPYPFVPGMLERIASNSCTRVVLISGRPAAEIPPLLGMQKHPEIWGSHGMERLLPDGEYHVVNLDPRLGAAFSKASASLDREGLSRWVEWKPGALAVHWRGLPREEVGEIWTTALRILQPLAFSAGLALSNFDGGVEMRVRTPNKGDVVRTVLKECGSYNPVAYLGDDITDEDAFTALNPLGLTVLIREDYRPTSAQLWLRPPGELLGFLEQWLHACGGDE
jgi:trehalose 6-phosphate phosphatase